MHDPQTFETRLGIALGRYADQMPTEVDASVFVRATRSARVPTVVVWRLARHTRLAVVLGLLVALALAAAVVVGTQPSPVRSYSGVFTPTASMGTGYRDHTATLLQDGRVLIVGRATEVAQIGSAELYDPRTETFSPTGPTTLSGLAVPTLLPYGRVLFLDGPEAELYDPKAGTFTPTASMVDRYGSPTTTLLQDGRVLIVGGSLEGEALATAELYDPQTGTFTPTGSMAHGRYIHTATLLQDGRVLVIGGEYGDGDVTKAELYDPLTETFTPTGPMVDERGEATATLLPDGSVLILGRWLTDDDEDQGTSAEIYDPTTDAFGPTGPTPYARGLPVATLLADGRVLVAGAWTHGADLYDPQAGTFTRTGSMVDLRGESTATLLQDGRVLIAGGSGERKPMARELLSSAELFQ